MAGRDQAVLRNRDLWQTLIGEVERWSDNRLEIKFWKIPREWNREADRWARDAVANERFSENFSTLMACWFSKFGLQGMSAWDRPCLEEIE